jgi:LuxR family maltose regulon positive regulatory protein
LKLTGDQLQPGTYEAYLGLARIFYQWNDLTAAQEHTKQGIELARQIENTDRYVLGELFLARLKLAQGDISSAIAILTRARQLAHQHAFEHLIPDIAVVQALALLRRGDLAGAAQLAEAHDLPLSRARVHLAQREPGAALAVLEPLRRQAEAKEWADDALQAMVLQAVALYAHGEENAAVQLLSEALALAAPGGFIRTFIDEGRPMTRLLSAAAAQGVMPDYVGRLLAAFEAEAQKRADAPHPPQPLVEPLTPRELEVLELIAQGLSNREIGERLFIALNTVKGHTRRIYGKLGVKNRTQAVNKARTLHILPLNHAK